MRVAFDSQLLALISAATAKNSGLSKALTQGKNLTGLIVEKRADGTVVLAIGDQKISLALPGTDLKLGEEVLFNLIREKMGGLFLEILNQETAEKTGGSDRVDNLNWGRLAARWAEMEPLLAEALNVDGDASETPLFRSFIDPVRSFFQVISSESQGLTPTAVEETKKIQIPLPGFPTKTPPGIKMALAVGERFAEDRSLSPYLRQKMSQWIADAKQILPLTLHPSAVLLKVVSGGEGIFRHPGKPLDATIEAIRPNGRMVLLFPNGERVEVAPPALPLAVGALLSVKPESDGSLVLLEARPPSPSSAISVPREVYDEAVRQAVEMKIIKSPQTPLPELLRTVVERASVEIAGPDFSPEETQSLVRQLLYLYVNGGDSAKVLPALSFFREAVSFGPRLFGMIEQLLEALKIPTSFDQLFLSRLVPGGGGLAELMPSQVPIAGEDADPSISSPVAEILRKLLNSLVPVRDDGGGDAVVRKEDLREFHRQIRGFTRQGLMDDLKANLQRLIPSLDRLELPSDTRARLTQEATRLLQYVESFQIKNLAEPEFLQLFLPIMDRQGPSTALVSFRRRGRRKKIDKNNTSLSLRLSLSALGHVEARVEVRRGFLWVAFLVEQSKWEPLFRDSLTDLTKRLQKTGYRLGALTVAAKESRRQQAVKGNNTSGLDLRA